MSGCCYFFRSHSIDRIFTTSWYSLHIWATTRYSVPCGFSALGRADTPCQSGLSNLIGKHWACSSMLGTSLSGIFPAYRTCWCCSHCDLPTTGQQSPTCLMLLLVALWDSEMPVFLLRYSIPLHLIPCQRMSVDLDSSWMTYSKTGTWLKLRVFLAFAPTSTSVSDKYPLYEKTVLLCAGSLAWLWEPEDSR